MVKLYRKSLEQSWEFFADLIVPARISFQSLSLGLIFMIWIVVLEKVSRLVRRLHMLGVTGPRGGTDITCIINFSQREAADKDFYGIRCVVIDRQ